MPTQKRTRKKKPPTGNPVGRPTDWNARTHGPRVPLSPLHRGLLNASMVGNQSLSDIAELLIEMGYKQLESLGTVPPASEVEARVKAERTQTKPRCKSVHSGEKC
jgi:hypothetical protein